MSNSQYIATVLLSPAFRDLVDLSLTLHKFVDFEPIGIASQRRSLSVHLLAGVYKVELAQEIGCKILKMAHKGTLEVCDTVGP